MALHHKLCHALGGSFDLRHAETHTVILPHVAAFNQSAAPKALERVARALDVDSAGAGPFAPAQSLGAPTALKAPGPAGAQPHQAAARPPPAPPLTPRPTHQSGRPPLACSRATPPPP